MTGPSERGIHLRGATPEDESFLFNLYATVRAPEFAMLPEAQRAHLIHMQYTAQTGAYRSMFPGTGYQIVLDGDLAIGRIWTVETEHDLRLVDIALLPDARNRGIGSVLLLELLRRGQSAGKPVRSSVFRFNPGSLRWHLRHGFRVTFEDETRIDLEWTPSTVPV